MMSGVIGILYGVSNVYSEFTWPSLSPALASIAMIVAVLCFKDTGGLCLAYGTLAGRCRSTLGPVACNLASYAVADFN